jgi:hypothetical protein
MQNSTTFTPLDTKQRLLDFVGGEALDGSGFELEQPESPFGLDEMTEMSEAEA